GAICRQTEQTGFIVTRLGLRREGPDLNKTKTQMRQGIGKPRIFIKAGRQSHRVFEPDTPEFPFQAGVLQAKLLLQKTAPRGGPYKLLQPGHYPVMHLLRIKTEKDFLNKGIHAAKIAVKPKIFLLLAYLCRLPSICSSR